MNTNRKSIGVWIQKSVLGLFVVLVVSIAGTSIANAATIAASVNPSFRADLMNTLKPQTGVGNPTFSRGTTATVVDFEGLIKPVLSGEARFVGARRVQNLLGNSESFDNGSWAKESAISIVANNTTAPDGTVTADKLVYAASGNRFLYRNDAVPSGAAGYLRNRTFILSVWARVDSGSSTLDLTIGTEPSSDYSSVTITPTTSWKRYSFKRTFSNANNGTQLYALFLGSLNANYYVWGAQLEEVTGQANQNTSEYVPTGKLSAPYQGAGVDGVQYFNTLNGNTVTSNVVTAGTGAAITSSTAKNAWMPGTASNYFYTPDSAAASVTGDIDIRAKIAPTDWTPSAPTVIIGKDDTSANRDYLFYWPGGSDGTIQLFTSADGTTLRTAHSTAGTTSFIDGTAHWVRVTRSASTGTATFYTSEDGATWTQLGATVATTAEGIHDGSTEIRLGGNSTNWFSGNIYRAQIYRGINGILAVDFNPNTWTSGTTWRSLTGETWTMNGSAIVFGGTGVWDATGPLGYLAEGVRTNLFTYSEQFDNAIWTKGTSSIVANATTSPDGTVSADKFMEDSSNGGHFIIGGPGSTSGHSYTVSLYAKAAGRSAIRLGASTLILGGGAGIAFSLTGAGSVIGAPANCTGTINYVGNGWYRVTMTLTATLTGGGGIFFNISDGTYLASYQGDGASGLYIWGASMEDNAVFASSYIPTTSGSVTRNSDILSYGGSNISNVFSAAFSVALESTVVDPTNWRILLSHTAWPQLIAAVQNTGNVYKMVLGGTHVDTGIGVTTTHMKMGIRSGSDNALFVGGTKISGGTIPSLGTGNNIQVGSINGATPAFGSIRELKIWKKPLSDSQFIGMTTNNNPLAKALIPQTTVKTPTKNGLVGQWSFNEGSGTKANDTSGLGNSGTLVNSPVWVAGKVGKALSFNGTNYVEVNDNSSLSIGGTQITVSVWVKPVAGDYRAILSKGYSSSDGGYAIRMARDSEPTKAFFQVYNSSGTLGSAGTYSNIPNGSWSHLIGTYDGTQVCFYVNGRLDGSCTALTGNIKTNSLPLRLGKLSASAGTTEMYGGLIDDVRIYNRALSSTEIAALYSSTSVVVNTLPAASSGSGLVGLWSFDGKDMNWTTSQALDRSGSGNNGTLVNMSTTTSPVIGKIGQGLKFNGSSQYVGIGSQLLTGTTDFTVATWIKSGGSQNTYAVPISQGHGSFTGFAFQYGYPVAADVQLIIGEGVTWKALSFNWNPVTDLAWHHLVATKVGSVFKTYKDGVLQTTYTASPFNGFGTYNFSIGEDTLNTDMNHRTWKGNMDDVRVYNRALSATEIKALYNSGR